MSISFVVKYQEPQINADERRCVKRVSAFIRVNLRFISVKAAGGT